MKKYEVAKEYGIDIIEECDSIREFAETLNSYIEVYPLKGNQDIYSYIIGIE